METSFDAIVVGAGYIGCSVAYHLAKTGLKTALFDSGSIAAGASRANYGNIQIQDMELEKSVDLVTRGWSYFSNLEQELDWKLGLRNIGSLLPIGNENQWQILSLRSKKLQSLGIASEMIPPQRLREVEPLINPDGLLGGLYHPHEAQLDPFQLIWAYLVRARQCGLKEYYFHEVTDFITQNDRLTGIVTPQGRYSAGCVILCTGAQTKNLGMKLGCDWNVEYTLGQALVTETIDQVLHNDITSASFFEMVAQTEPGTIIVNMTIGQSVHGNLLLGETMFTAAHHRTAIPYQSFPAIATCVSRYFPSFKNLHILRGWSAAVAHTTDGLPLLGAVPSHQGLYLATAFRSTVIVTPLIGETIAQLIMYGASKMDIRNFSPDRISNAAH